jgi:hypothetical protein
MSKYKTLLASGVLLLTCGLGNAALAAPDIGWWWNPNESGRGFFVESHDGVTFIGAYLYDDDGHAKWLVSGGPNADPYNWTGDLVYTTNGQTLFGNYVAPGDVIRVGTLTAHFDDDSHGTITWPGGTVQIEREIYGGGEPPLQLWNGWWWNPDESGSGYSVELQGDKLFIVGFMYDDSGRPVWYFSAGPMSDATTYHGDVLQFGNGQTMGGPYHPPTSQTKIATLDVSFSTEANEATFEFTESSSAGALSAQAGRRSSKRLKPQLKKDGSFVFPPQYKGNFNLYSHFEGPGTSLQWTLSAHDLVFVQDGDGIGKYTMRPSATLLEVSVEGEIPNCTTISGGVQISIPADTVKITVFNWQHPPNVTFDVEFNLPPVSVDDAMGHCIGADGQPFDVPLPAAWPGAHLSETRKLVALGTAGSSSLSGGPGYSSGGYSNYCSFTFSFP